MAKSLNTILTQIERLQKQAASIQSEVIARIRKEIEKYGLTAEQLFGATAGRRRAAPAKSPRGKSAGVVKYADGTGNTWGGRGKRPDWLRQALEAGKSLDDFLVGGEGAAAPAPAGRKRAAAAKPAGAKRRAGAKTAARKSAPRKRGAKPAAESTQG
jgi:DNA-binding protein H-NS